jgi:phosphoglycerate kinase
MLPIAEDLSVKLGKPVRLIKDYLEIPPEVANGEAVLLENVRFNAGEKKDDPALARQYAALCDVFVMDAFGTAHRAQASTRACCWPRNWMHFRMRWPTLHDRW